MKLRPFLFPVFAAFVLSGCANTTKQHFDPDAANSATSKTAPTNLERSTVYLMREWALGQGFLPPVYFAVDGVMVSTMPLGAYVPLSLVPGSHTFSRFTVVPGGGLARFEIARADVKLQLAVGRVYYVSEVNALWDTFREVDAKQGQAILKDANLAKFYHSPVTVSAFTARIAADERDRKAAAQTSPAPVAAGPVPLRDYVASPTQTSAAFESIASLALTILGIVAEGAEEARERRAVVPAWQPSPIARRSASTAMVRQEEPASKRPSFVPVQVESKGRELVYKDYNSGSKYIVDGDRITGSDGSRGRVVGSTLYFDSGQSYQRAGNTLTGSDGRSCQLIGETLYCK